MQPRKLLSKFWSQSLEISPQVFVLMASTYAQDTLNRSGRERCSDLLNIVRQHQNVIIPSLREAMLMLYVRPQTTFQATIR